MTRTSSVRFDGLGSARRADTADAIVSGLWAAARKVLGQRSPAAGIVQDDN